jgi:hypothetical protein
MLIFRMKNKLSHIKFLTQLRHINSYRFFDIINSHRFCLTNLTILIALYQKKIVRIVLHTIFNKTLIYTSIKRH